MTPFDELQREHERLLEGADAVELAAIIAYIDRARAQAAQIGDPRERDQLRANLRYWASVVYDRSGTYPATTLLPSAAINSTTTSSQSGQMTGGAQPSRRAWPWLMGIAIVALLAVVLLLSESSLLVRPTPSQPAGGLTPTSAGGIAQLQPLMTTTDLYNKPGSDSAAQILGRMQAGSQFYAVARTTDAQWLKITSADAVSGWISATASGLSVDQLQKLPEAAIVIVSTPTSAPTPAPSATPVATAMPASTATLAPLSPVTITPRPSPTRSVVVGPTPPLPPNALPLQVNYQLVTYGPSPFNAEAWVIEIQLTAAGGDGHYVFWVNGRRLGIDRYTIDGEACRAVTITLGATSGGQAVRRDVILKSPLATCK